GDLCERLQAEEAPREGEEDDERS
ncbi:MAG: hypothetical protein QOD25_3762, partial [Alphaproteobacteria bacterium]|nr:hypothetical protein [Alphaproteobacteria bacterium]